ncbi:MAG: site-specific integrase [Gordonia paraffinivorans]
MHLDGVRLDIARGLWQPPGGEVQQDHPATIPGTRPVATRTVTTDRRASNCPTFAVVAEEWITGRTNGVIGKRPLRPRTVEQYRMILKGRLLPAFGNKPVDTITAADVKAWHLTQAGTRGKRAGKPTPTMSAQSYDLLQTIMKWQVREGVIPTTPCVLDGAGVAPTAHKPRPATPAELVTMCETMPDRLQATVLFGAWCAMRFGEIIALRRSDIDLRHATVNIDKAVTHLKTGATVGSTKTDAGTRVVSIPPHILPDIAAHLSEHVRPGRDALLFTNLAGGYLSQTSFRRPWLRAAEAAGRPGFHFHDLRHTGATMAGQAGASIAELQHRLGHATVQAAMRYQHATIERDKAIAESMSALA